MNSKILKYSVIGCGVVSERHCNAINSLDNARLISVCDVNIERAIELSSKLPEVKAEIDYCKVLDDASIDAVVICLPTFLHEEAVSSAALKGKHIFLEKPISINSESARMMIQQCKKNKVKLFMGHSRRYFPEIQTIKRIIKKGTLGQIFKARIIDCTWLDYTKDKRTWKWDPKKDIGGILNTGIHYADCLRYILESEPVSVFSHMRNVRPDDTLQNNHCTALIEFTNGISAVWEICEAQFNRNNNPGLPEGSFVELYGNKGALYTNFIDTIAISYINEDGVKNICEEFVDGWHSVWSKMHQDFIMAINGEKPLAVTGEEGYESLRLIEAIIESGEKGKLIKLNSNKKH